MQLFLPMGHRLWLYALCALVVLFLIVPTLIVVPMSFSGSAYLTFPPPSWSLRWYQRFFSEQDWYEAMLVSLELGAATAVIAAPLGVAAAYAIHQGHGRLFRRIQLVLMLPLMVPQMIVAIGVFYVYVKFGWLGSFPGLVAAHVMLALPFMVVTTSSGLSSLDRDQELAARSLGCNRVVAFLWVTLPQIMASVLSGLLFVFVISLDEVLVSLFVSAGENSTITKVMFTSVRDEINPTIAAVSSLLIVCSLIVTAAAALLPRLSRK